MRAPKPSPSLQLDLSTVSLQQISNVLSHFVQRVRAANCNVIHHSSRKRRNGKMLPITATTAKDWLARMILDGTFGTAVGGTLQGRRFTPYVAPVPVAQPPPPPPVPPELSKLGYLAFIDALLLDVDDAPPIEGFKRSKFTVQQALRIVLAQFPDKDAASAKRIIKVRPRHLERSKSQEFDDVHRAPRWAYVGPGFGTGLMRRIDELLLTGQHTTRSVGEIVAREFGRDLKSTLVLVHARPSQLQRKTGQAVEYPRMVDPDAEPPRLVRKRRNAALLAEQLVRASMQQAR